MIFCQDELDMGLYHQAGPSTPFAFVQVSAIEYIHFTFKTHETGEQNNTISAANVILLYHPYNTTQHFSIKGG